MNWPPSLAFRRWTYRVATAGLVVAGIYGLVNSEEAAGWLLVIAAVTGMADMNVPKKEEK